MFLFTLKMNDIWILKKMLNYITFSRMFGILKQCYDNQVTRSRGKPHDYSYIPNIKVIRTLIFYYFWYFLPLVFKLYHFLPQKKSKLYQYVNRKCQPIHEKHFNERLFLIMICSCLKKLVKLGQ